MLGCAGSCFEACLPPAAIYGASEMPGCGNMAAGRRMHWVQPVRALARAARFLPAPSRCRVSKLPPTQLNLLPRPSHLQKRNSQGVIFVEVDGKHVVVHAKSLEVQAADAALRGRVERALRRMQAALEPCGTGGEA